MKIQALDIKSGDRDGHTLMSFNARKRACPASDPRTLGNSSMRETLTARVEHAETSSAFPLAKTALPRNGLSRKISHRTKRYRP